MMQERERRRANVSTISGKRWVRSLPGFVPKRDIERPLANLPLKNTRQLAGVITDRTRVDSGEPDDEAVESTASPQMIGKGSQFDIGFRGRSGRRTLSWIQRLNCRTGGSICSASASLTETCCVNKDCTCLISSSLIVWPMPG